jgi:ketosteroid isomerase-like protein
MRAPLPLVALVLLFTTALGCSSDPEETDSTPAVTASSPDAATASHLEVVRRRIAANNAKDWDTWQALHTENAVRTAPELPAPLVGAKAMRDSIEELTKTFPDYHLELVDGFGSGNRLVARIHTRATMLGPLDVGTMTAPATGKVFEQDWVAVLSFEGDRIATIDEFHDNYGILVQLGLTGAP